MEPDPLHLADAGDWDALASRLVELCSDPETQHLAESAVLHLMSRGRVNGLLAALRAESGPGKPLFLRIVEADAAVRVGEATYPDLVALDGEVSHGDRTDWHLWMAAILVEHFTWQADVGGLPVARAAIEGAAAGSGGVTRSKWVLMGRGRLQRWLAVEAAGSADTGDGSAELMMSEALSDLAAAGCDEEVATSRALMAFFQGLVHREDLADSIDAIEDALATMRRLGSDRWPLAQIALGWARAVNWEFAAARTCVAEFDRGWGPLPGGFVGARILLEAALDLVEDDPGADLVARLQFIADEMRSRSPFVGGALIFVGGLLADAGLGDLARRFALPADGIAPLPLVTYMDALTLQARCEVLENPGPDTVQALEDVLARCESVGPARRAAGAALRAAWDCERVGLADEAQRLRSRGLRGLPPQGEWTQREVYYAARLSGIGTNVNHNGALGVRPGEILVLGPDVVMRRYGREVHTGGMAARMVVLLVAHRRAVTTDWLLEQLWPGEDPEVGRNRLKGLLFRSRRLLDLGRGELFVRDEHGISLVPGPAWRIDAWDFWDLSRGSTPERRQAFELYRGDLCFRQFAYDDELAAERGRLRDRWLELTLGLLAEGEMDAGDVADRALRLGIEEPLLQVALGHIGPGE